VVHDGTGTASKTDHYTGGKTMRRKDQSQINTKSMERDAAIQIIGGREAIPRHFKTTINCVFVPCFDVVSAWAVRPGVVVIDSYTVTAREADLRAMRLFSRLGALGCVRNHMTQSA
jgi:hypothetical protein